MTGAAFQRAASRALVLALGLSALPAVAAETGLREPLAPESYLEDWAANLIQDIDFSALDLPSDEEMRDLGKQFDAFFASGSLDDVAWILPEAREALVLCDEIPELKPYADWLRQRMDYLETASRLVNAYPSQTPLPPPPRKPDPLNRFSLPRPPPPPPVTKAMMAKREEAVRNKDTWLKTLANRPIPAAGMTLVPVIKKVFVEEGLPHQLVWIAEVESTFNPKARSPSGAVGLFQLMPDTAKRLGLRLFPFDQRHSAELSARAAARYLRFLYEEFGSWPLAIAGYNAGEGSVGRALAKKEAASYDAIAPTLPLQTRLYVPKVLTLIELREKTDPVKLPAPRPVKN